MATPVILDSGLQAALNRADGNINFTINTFRLSNGLGATSSTRTDLTGTVVHTGAVTDSVRISTNQIEYRLLLERDVGNFTFGEIGLYFEDDSGDEVLFAIVVLDNLFTKNRTSGFDLGNIWRLSVSLVFDTRLTSNLMVNYERTEIARFPEVGTPDLLPAAGADTNNVYLVRSTNDIRTMAFSPSDESLWFFSNYFQQWEADITAKDTNNEWIEVVQPAGVNPLATSGHAIIQATEGGAVGRIKGLLSAIGQTGDTYRLTFTEAGGSAALMNIGDEIAYYLYSDTGRVNDIAIPNNSINTAQLAPGAVGTNELKDDSVTLAKMEHGTAGQYLSYDTNGNPTRMALSLDNLPMIDQSRLSANSVGRTQLQDNSVGTDQIANDSVTLADMAHGTAGQMIIYDSSGAPFARTLAASDLPNIQTNNIADGAIAIEKLTHNIGPGFLAYTQTGVPFAVQTGSRPDRVVVIGDEGVPETSYIRTRHIVEGNVTLEKMARGTTGEMLVWSGGSGVTPSKLLPGTQGQVLTMRANAMGVTEPTWMDAASISIPDNDITLAKMEHGSPGQYISYDVNGNPIRQTIPLDDLPTITESKIGDDAIIARHIRAGQVGNTELASGSVSSDKIASGAITASSIADDTIRLEHWHHPGEAVRGGIPWFFGVNGAPNFLHFNESQVGDIMKIDRYTSTDAAGNGVIFYSLISQPFETYLSVNKTVRGSGSISDVDIEIINSFGRPVLSLMITRT